MNRRNPQKYYYNTLALLTELTNNLYRIVDISVDNVEGPIKRRLVVEIGPFCFALALRSRKNIAEITRQVFGEK